MKGDYYLDGPVFLKSGISLVGESGEGSPYNTELNLHGSGTGADGVINADSIEGAVVSFEPLFLIWLFAGYIGYSR